MRLLTAQDVARLLRMTPQRVYAMARGGELPVVRVGQRVRFDEAQIRRWIDSGGCPLGIAWSIQKTSPD